MCYGPSARPPHPPIAGGAGVASSGDLIIEAADGTRFMAFSATTSDPDAPGIVIFPDVRGLHPFFTELALRYAEAGVHATAFDYFGRTAGIGDRGEGFGFRSHVQQVTPAGIREDATAALAHLTSEGGGGANVTYSVGFCLGGRHSFNLAASDLGVGGVIGFYGFPAKQGPQDDVAPVDLAPRYRVPVLGFFGADDREISSDEVDAFRRALDGAHVPNEIVRYEGAGHSFFDRHGDANREACDDAWARMLRFVGARSSGT
jgi:carboxymethylenebutenolidase